MKEYQQLDNLGVFEPLMPTEVSKNQKLNALNANDLIKQKRCGKIKGRTVADGRKQRDLYTKSEVYSPALSLEGFLATLLMDAKEGQHVAIADIAGAFLKAGMNDLVIGVKLQGPTVDAILKVNKQKYNKYVSYSSRKKTIYVKLKKAMYCAITAPLLWYTLFSRTLLNKGFKINPYDSCVANKVVIGHQFTICWYVDDIKVSHKHKRVVNDMIKRIENKFYKMTITHGNKQTYLGMQLEIRDIKVNLQMSEYLQDFINDFPEEITKSAKLLLQNL